MIRFSLSFKMNQVKLYVLILFSVVALFAGCVTYYPQVVDIPLIEEKDDLKIDAGMSYMCSAYGTVSYGLTNIVAVQAFGNVDILSRYHLQGAVGLYKWFDESLTGIELYGGYGYGNCLFDSPNTTTGAYHLVFTQFNIGRVEMGESNIDLGLGLKGGYLFGNFVNLSDLKTVHKENGMIIEPTVLFRFESRREVKFSIKINYVLPVTIDRQHALFYPFNFSIGRQF